MHNWQDIIDEESKKPYFQLLMDKINEEEQSYTIYPAKNNIYKALELTPLSNVKVVLLGQDPYHEPNQACGLAFSVPQGEKIPPSLKNIYQELHDDIGMDIPNHGDLTTWAKQGVLLLNTVLTVRAHHALSHHNFGWQDLTDSLIKACNEVDHPIVFILLGNDAKTKKELITNKKHFIIENVHPSPLSAYRGFFGSKIFSKCNEYLKASGIEEINWNSVNE